MPLEESTKQCKHTWMSLYDISMLSMMSDDANCDESKRVRNFISS